MNNQSDDDRRAAKREHRKHFWKIQILSSLGGLGGIPLVKHPDERIASTAQEWAARAGKFLSIALGIDICVRTYVLRQNPQQYWDISLIWGVNVFLVCIGQTRSGVAPFYAVGKLTWKTAGWILYLALLIPVLVLWLNGGGYSLKAYVVGTAIAAVSAFVTLKVIRGIYSKWERKNLGNGSEE